MALIYNGFEILTTGHVDFSSHDLDRVIWDDPVVGEQVVWERQRAYTLTFGTMGYGIVTATVNGVSVTSPAQVVSGSSVVITATPSTHCHFTQWSDGTTTNPKSFTMNSDVSLYGSFAQDTQYTLRFSAVNGSVSSSYFTGYTGDQVTVTVTPNPSYTFIHWNDGNQDNPRTFTIGTESVSYTASCGEVWDGLRFTRVSGEAPLTMHINRRIGDIPPMFYSVDRGITWAYISSVQSISVSFDDTIYLRSTYLRTSSIGDDSYGSRFSFSGQGLDFEVEVSGRLDSLDYGGDTRPPYDFARIFEGSNIKYAHNLIFPTTGLSEGCFLGMFWGCTSLVTAPSSLPATTLSADCYKQMFDGCTSLVTVPEIAATNYSKGSCFSMFSGCTSLVNVSTVIYSPFSHLGASTGHFSRMFFGCTSLVIPPVIYVRSQDSMNIDFSAMFKDCTSLTGPVEIHSIYTPTGTGNMEMFSNAGTSRPYTPTGYNNINIDDGNVEGWYTPGGVDRNYWNVQIVSTKKHVVTFSCSFGSVNATVDGVSVQSPAIVDNGKTVVFTIIPYSGYEYTGTNPESVVVTSAVDKNYACTPLVTPLKFTSTGDSTISFNQNGTWSGSWGIQTSTDGSTWTSYTLGTTISLSNGQSIYWRGIRDSTAQTSYNYRKFVMTGSIAASGDITSLFNWNGGITDLSSYGNYTFNRMFNGCTSLTSAPSLPATTLTSYCYYYMFYDCTSLTTAPILPSTSLAAACYRGMFEDCLRLTGPVNISATSPYYTESASACLYMFHNAGTAEGAGGTINVGSHAYTWNYDKCGIDSNYWTVELLPSDVDEQESNE